MGDETATVVSKPNDKQQAKPSGKKSTFVLANQKFYLQLKITDPADPTKLKALPAGIKVQLMNLQKQVPGPGAKVETDANGKVCLTPDNATAQASPNYHFRVEFEKRMWLNTDDWKLVTGKDLAEIDKKNYMELPRVIDTRLNQFYFDDAKLKMKGGMLEKYPADKTGEGTDGDPIVLELRFYWFALCFKYWDRIRDERREVGRGLALVPRVHDRDDYWVLYSIDDNAVPGGKIANKEIRAQFYLNMLGYDCGPELNGALFAAKSKEAVKAFQKTHKLKEDGLANDAFMKLLEHVYYRHPVSCYDTATKSYRVPVWKTRAEWKFVYFDVANPKRWNLMSLEDAKRYEPFYFTKDKTTEPVIVDRRKIAEDNAEKHKDKKEYEKLPYTVQRLYYDLPGEWSSQNYWTRYDNDYENKGARYTEVMKDKLTLFPFVADDTKRADLTKPLMFSLDDIVLTNKDREQALKDAGPGDAAMDLDDNSRYALFHIDHATDGDIKDKRNIKIHKPETAQPIFTDFKFKTNLISDVPGYACAVYFCNRFYPVYNKRARKADKSFKQADHVLGARIAVTEDDDLHRLKKISATTAQDVTDGFALSQCGNYELHYLHNCAVLEDKPLSYLVVYWSCRLANATAPAGTQADIDNQRKSGMTNAMARLNKAYLLEKSTGDADIYIRPYHFLEAKNDTNGGAHKAIVNIVTDASGSWMLPASGQLRAGTYQDECNRFGNPDPINAIADTDGSTYCPLANHHEFGHATGNWDDYLYSYSDSAGNTYQGLPKYDQPYTAIGGPYSCDKLSRMFRNRTPRLRNYWKFVCWINDAAKANQPLNKLLNASKFKITFQGSAHKHEFELKEAHRNVAIAAHTDMNHTFAANITGDLLLYKLGDDELSRLITNGQVFNAILAVRTKFALRFDNDPTGGNWDIGAQRTWATKLNDDMVSMLQLKFRAATATANDFQNVYVHFVPHFSTYTGAAPGASHINVRVKFAVGGGFVANGKTLSVDWDTDTARIIRYCFGLAAGNAALTKTDFATMLTWLGGNAVGNAVYAMHDL